MSSAKLTKENELLLPVQLQLAIRRADVNPSSSNNVCFNFVRMSPMLARRLYDIALTQIQSLSSRINQQNAWLPTPHSYSSSSSSVEFLPLRLCIPLLDPTLISHTQQQQQVIVYASYNGGYCLDDSDDTVNLSEVFLSTILENETSSSNGPLCSHHSMNTTMILVQPLPFVLNAASVQLEPLTTSDWELIEIYSQDLEDGGLLQQVSIVYPHQIVNLMLGSSLINSTSARNHPTQRDVVRVRVLPQGFLPQEGLYEEESSPPSCLRLVANTQIVIQPKPRMNNSMPSVETKSLAEDKEPQPRPVFNMLRVQPHIEHFNDRMLQLHRSLDSSSSIDKGLRKNLPNPPQGTAWVHPTFFQQHESMHYPVVACVWKHDPSSCEDILSSIQEGDVLSSSSRIQYPVLQNMAIVNLYPSTCISQEHIVLHPNTCLQLQVYPLFDHVWVQIRHNEQQAKNDFQHHLHQYNMHLQLHPVHIQTLSMNYNLDDLSRIKDNPKKDPSTTKSRESFSFHTLYNDKAVPLSIPGNMLLYDGCIITLSPGLCHTNGCNRFQLMLVFSEPSQRQDKDFIHPFIRFYRNDFQRMIRGSRVTVSGCQRTILLPDDINLLPRRPCCLGDTMSDERKQIEFNKNLMIFGEQGSGKTYRCLLAAAEIRLCLDIATVYLDCRMLQSYSVANALQQITAAFHRAVFARSSLLILDDLDVLLPNVRIGDDQKPTLDTAQHQSQTSPALIQKAKMILDHLIFLFESTHDTASIHDSGSHRVALICTCRNEQSIHHELLQVTRFPERFEITKSLRQDQRVHLFKAMMADLQLPLLNADQLKVLITKTDGYRPMDVHTVATRVASAYELNRLRENLSSLKDDELLSKLINENLLSYTPLSKKSFTQEAYRVTTSWPFIGGLFKAKEDLAHIILRPVRYKGIYNHCPISLPRGILLFGPSGCGKSCIVPALAEEIGFNLVTCRGPEILDKYIGMSEAKVRRLFEQAYAMTPSILFFDDFDALAPKRGRDTTGATDRVVNQLLTYLDGVEGRMKEKGYVYVIAATSRPDKVDPALLRPGRLESHIYIGPPENTDELADLFSKIVLSRNDLGKDLQDWIQSGLYLTDLAEINIGYHTMLTPAEVRSAFDDARLSSLHSKLLLQSASSSNLFINRDQLISALSNLQKRSHHMTMKFPINGNVYEGFRQGRNHNMKPASQDCDVNKQILR